MCAPDVFMANLACFFVGMVGSLVCVGLSFEVDQSHRRAIRMGAYLWAFFWMIVPLTKLWVTAVAG